MSEQARRGILSGALFRGRPGLNATAPRMAFLRGLSRPPISAPIPANGLFSLGVSDYSARIKSCLLGWLLVQRSSAGAGSGNQLWLWLVIEPFPLRFPKSQPRGEEEEEEEEEAEDVGRRREEDEDFFSKFALMTPPS